MDTALKIEIVTVRMSKRNKNIVYKVSIKCFKYLTDSMDKF